MSGRFVEISGSKVRSLREGRMLSRQALAERAGMSGGGLARLEQGESTAATGSTIGKLAAAFGMTPESFHAAVQPIPAGAAPAPVGHIDKGKGSVVLTHPADWPLCPRCRRLYEPPPPPEQETLEWRFAPIAAGVASKLDLSLPEVYELVGLVVPPTLIFNGELARRRKPKPTATADALWAEAIR